jgi:cold shock CspA family protein
VAADAKAASRTALPNFVVEKSDEEGKNQTQLSANKGDDRQALPQLPKIHKLAKPVDVNVGPPDGLASQHQERPAQQPQAKQPPKSNAPRIPSDDELVFGQVVTVIAEKGFGFIQKKGATEEVFWNIKQLGGVLPIQGDWLLFAEQPSRRHPDKWEVKWARPLSFDKKLFSRQIRKAEEPSLLALLGSSLPDEYLALLVEELLERVPVVSDVATAGTASRLLDAVCQKAPEAAVPKVKSLLATAAPEFAWQLWLRFSSPLMGSNRATLVARLLHALDKEASWWAAAEQQGLVGLAIAYLQRLTLPDATVKATALRSALGPEQQTVYEAAVQDWLGLTQLPLDAHSFRLRQAIVHTLDTSLRPSLEKQLLDALPTEVGLELWLSGVELPFPQAAALEQFATLPGIAQLKVAGQLADEQFWLVARYLTDDCVETLKQRAREVAHRFVFSSLHAFAVDVESDRTTMREVAWGWPDAWHAGTGETQVAATLDELAAHVEAGSYVAIGHNLRDFDAPELAAQQVDLQPESLWDTLLVELALSPRLHTYALRTAHTALADAKLAWQLFENQAWRLLLVEAPEWELLQQLFSIEITEKITELRAHLAGAKWLATTTELQAQAVGWLRPQAPPTILLTKVREALADDELPPTQLVLAATNEWGALSQLPGLQFYGGAEADLEYQELDESAMRQQLAQHPVESVWAARFFMHCRQTGLVPTAAAMPSAMRVRLRQHVVLADCLVAQEPFDWQKPLHYCLTPEQVLAEYPRLQDAARVGVVVVEPELLTLGNKKLLRDKLTINDLLASESSRTEWLKFSGGQSFVALTREQAIDLRAEIPAGYERFWLEKRRYGSFQVWGSFGWEALLNRLDNQVVRHVRGHEWAFPKGQLRSLAVDAGRLQQRLGVTPFHPESIYRARYWLLQAELVDSISRRGQAAPPVLLATRPEEVALLARYFKQRGYFVPDQNAHPARQLELLHDSPRERRLLVAALDQGSTLLQANYRGPIELLLDGFALGENYFLAQGTPLFKQAFDLSGGKSATDDQPSSVELDQTDDQPPGANIEEDEPEAIPPASPPVTYEFLTRDTQFLLHLQLPLVRRWQALALDNHSDNRVWLLDPRLSETPGLAASWNLQTDLLDAPWQSEEDYQRAAQQAEELFGGSKPTTDWQLDLEEAKQLLQLVFLQLWDSQQERLVQYEWKPEQIPYLHKILPATANLSLLVSLPTGGGKSLLFQGPALYRSAYTNRLSIVITPLKALMEDQVAGLWQRGFYSSVDYLNQDKQDEVQQIYSRLAGGELMLLFITPERFRSRGFTRAFAQRLASDGGLEYAIFDEAHCISQWGHEFRPDYLHAARTVQGHRDVSSHKFPVLLFSATVTEKIYEGFSTLFG